MLCYLGIFRYFLLIVLFLIFWFVRIAAITVRWWIIAIIRVVRRVSLLLLFLLFLICLFWLIYTFEKVALRLLFSSFWWISRRSRTLATFCIGVIHIIELSRIVPKTAKVFISKPTVFVLAGTCRLGWFSTRVLLTWYRGNSHKLISCFSWKFSLLLQLLWVIQQVTYCSRLVSHYMSRVSEFNKIYPLALYLSLLPSRRIRWKPWSWTSRPLYLKLL